MNITERDISVSVVGSIRGEFYRLSHYCHSQLFVCSYINVGLWRLKMSATEQFEDIKCYLMVERQ
jgi:hypothetical protein